MPTPALYQVQNAALAVAAVRLLLGGLDAAAARQALAGTAVPGRLQVVGERPLVLADGAHNPDGVRVLAQSLAAVQVPRPTVGVLAIMRDKDYPAMLAGLLPLLDRVVCTQASEPRSLTAGELAAAVADATGRDRPVGGAAVETVDDPHAAWLVHASWPGRTAACSSEVRSTCWRTCATCSPDPSERCGSRRRRVLPVPGFGYTVANLWRGEWQRRKRIRHCDS